MRCKLFVIFIVSWTVRQMVAVECPPTKDPYTGEDVWPNKVCYTTFTKPMQQVFNTLPEAMTFMAKRPADTATRKILDMQVRQQ